LGIWTDAVACRFVAHHRGQREAIGDALAPPTQIWRHPERLPAPAMVQPEAGAHLVDDQHRPDVVAERANTQCEIGIRELLVEAGVVLVRRHDDRCHVTVRSIDSRGNARHVVEREVPHVGVIVGIHVAWYPAPRCDAVVGAGGLENLFPSCLRFGDGDGEVCRVGAVLGEHRPRRSTDPFDQ
jgi:hypothetical protein